MKVILFENVDNLGLPGEICNVKPGYFRNFLGPKGVAVEATPKNLKAIEMRRKKLDEAASKLRDEAMSLGDRLQKLKLEFTLKAGAGGRLFGSVTAHDVAERLAELGFDVDRRRVTLPGPVKTLGTSTAKIKLAGGVQVSVKLVVVSDAPVQEEPEAVEADDEVAADDGEEAEAAE